MCFNYLNKSLNNNKYIKNYSYPSECLNLRKNISKPDKCFIFFRFQTVPAGRQRKNVPVPWIIVVSALYIGQLLIVKP
jgi:hypothetical protein